MFPFMCRVATVLLLGNLCLSSAFAQVERPAPTLNNAEKLETIAHMASAGQLGCGIGSFEYIDRTRNKRTVRSGLDPIHVFGNQISAETMSTFMKSRASAIRTQKGPMQGQRRYLMYTVLEVVSGTRDADFIEDLVPLLDDPDLHIKRNAQIALLRVGEANPDDREAILKELQSAKWNPESLPEKICSWVKTGR